MSVTRDLFGPDFAWGVSTAAYQIEGAYNHEGKGTSIWDEFVKQPRKIFQQAHAKEACDFYHRFSSDTELIRSLHIPNHRFSIAWSRILPNGIGQVNQKGIDFYNKLIDESLANGVEPWITLYHWDLPLELEKKGGWTNREVILWFTYFVEQCVKHFGDRVKNWIVLNEPMVFTGAGYFLGVHAPGRKGLSNFLPAVHHAALCQAEGGRVIRKLVPGANIGTTFSCSWIEPYRDLKRDIIAARKADVLFNRMFIEPLLGLGYPTKDLKILRRIERYMRPGDEKKLQFDMDFVGLQNYTRELVKFSPLMPFVRAQIVKASKRKVPSTQMDWEIYPEAMYYMLKQFAGYKNIPKIIVTENGAAFGDKIVNGRINDEQRTKFIRDHITQVLRAKKENVPVAGYFVWTLLDNFEWAEGYYPKFGLIHVNHETQERIVKESGNWYKSFLSNTAGETAEEQEYKMAGKRVDS